jgi:ABC-type branched-subunit amino acid transport system substrate-binding protein
MNIGILYPRSKAHAGLAFDFLDGLKSFLKQQQLGGSLKLLPESIGFGGDEKEVYEKAEKLLMIEGVDILIAYIDQRVMGILNPLFYSAGKLVIVINPGANYPLNWVPQPNVVQLTLQHAFLCWQSGQIAGRAENNNAALVTTYYDCGYLHGTAMVKSFLKEKGNITFNYVNSQLYDQTFEISKLTDFLSENKETVNLLAVCDDLPASMIYQQLNAFNTTGELHLFVSPMMLEPKALENLKDGFNFSIDGFTPWLPTTANEANKNFTDFYQQHTKRPASIFSVLGWEAGMILHQLQNEDNYGDGATLAEALQKIKINGPRGLLQLDADTNFFLAPFVKCSIKNNSGHMETETVDAYEKEWQAFINEPTEGVISGWMNTYLCY